MTLYWLCLLSVLTFTNADRSQRDAAILAKLESLESKLNLMHNDFDARLNELENKEQSSAQNNFIGFTAYSNVDLYVTNGQTVVYNTAETNEGDGYDTTTGVFTCPVTGLYFFGTAVYSSESFTSIQLVKAGTGLTGSFADAAVADQGANFWVVQCTEGEAVWTRLTNTSGTILAGWTGNILQSFVGFLIALSG